MSKNIEQYSRSGKKGSASEHQKEMLEDYAEALEEKQEDSGKGVKNKKKNQPKEKKKEAKSKDNKNEVDNEDDVEDTDEARVEEGEDDDLFEDDVDEFGNVVGKARRGTGNSSRKGQKKKSYKRKIDDDADDEHETTVKRKRRGRGASSAALLDSDQDGVNVNINFGSNSGGGSDDQSQEDEIAQSEMLAELSSYDAIHENMAALSENKKSYMQFIAEFADKIEQFTPQEYAKREALILHIMRELFGQFLDGMNKFSKETKQHQVFGQGARLLQEISRALKSKDLMRAKSYFKKLVMHHTKR